MKVKQWGLLNLEAKTKYNLLANKNLIIHNLSKSDDNQSYACIVKNQIDKNLKQSRFKSLRIRGNTRTIHSLARWYISRLLDRSPFGPELSIPNNTEYQAEIGDLVELPCGISSISTNAHISWWKDGHEIRHDKDNLYNNSLIFQLASSTQSGNYTCRVDDESIGRMTSTISLKVHGGFFFRFPPDQRTFFSLRSSNQMSYKCSENNERYCTIYCGVTL